MKKLSALLLIWLASFSYGQQTVIPVDQAFHFSAQLMHGNQLQLNWQVTPGYQLYQYSIDIEIIDPPNVQLMDPDFPPGVEKSDPFQGIYVAYTDRLQLNLAISYPNEQPLTILVHYQGCADSGYCYPPITKQLQFPADAYTTTATITEAAATSYTPPTTTAALTEVIGCDTTPCAEHMLLSHNWLWIMGGFLLFGVLLSFTPCVLPMIPILSGLIIGQRKNLTTAKAFRLSLTYVIAMAGTFAVAGAMAGLLGFSIQAVLQKPWILISVSILFVLLALSLFGFYELRLPHALAQRLHQWSHQQKGGTYLGVAIMGILATLIASPCVTPPLIGTLTYISQTGDALLGGIALFMMGLGMGIPLIIIGTTEGKLLPKVGPWMHIIKDVFGVMLLGIAIWLLSRIVPDPISLLMWAALFMISAMYMGAFNTNLAKGWPRFWQGVSWLMFVYAVILIIGASLGNGNPLQPLGRPLTQVGTATTITQPPTTFTSVKSLDGVEAALQQAVRNHQPTLLKFSADWCITCKILDEYVFPNPDVQAALNHVMLLQADVTANDTIDRALQQHFNVFAPPALLFFDAQGNEILAARIVGDISAENFITHLRQHHIIQ